MARLHGQEVVTCSSVLHLICRRFFKGAEETPADVHGDAAEKAADFAEVPAADAECLCIFGWFGGLSMIGNVWG